MTLKKVSVCLLLTSIIVAAATHFSFASIPQLVVVVATEKSQYYYRQLVNVYGNVSYDGELVQEGLVSIQVQDPNGKTIALRTVPANATPLQDWSVEIDSIIPCDMGGNPKDTFTKNTIAYFKVTVRNNAVFGDRNVLVTINHYDVDSTPFFLINQSLTVPPQKNVSAILEAPINEWVSTGSAVAYANLYEDVSLPKDGGCALCPEKSASFTITESGGASASSTLKTSQLNEKGNFWAAVRLPPNALLGAYLVSVSAYYKGWLGFNTLTFSNEYKMLEDLVINRTIDIYDVVMVAGAYGSKGGDPSWNPEADIQPNGKIDIYDVVQVTSNYGTTY